MTREQEHCHGAASRCCLSTPQASSFPLPPSNASGRLGRTLYWLSHHVEQTHNERYPSHQKNYQHHFHIRATLTCFVLVIATIFPSTATTEHLFRHRSRTPKFHHLLWHFSESFHQHSNDQTAPDWQWHGSLSVHLSADAAQILRQNNM